MRLDSRLWHSCNRLLVLGWLAPLHGLQQYINSTLSEFRVFEELFSPAVATAFTVHKRQALRSFLLAFPLITPPGFYRLQLTHVVDT